MHCIGRSLQLTRTKMNTLLGRRRSGQFDQQQAVDFNDCILVLAVYYIVLCIRCSRGAHIKIVYIYILNYNNAIYTWYYY